VELLERTEQQKVDPCPWMPVKPIRVGILHSLFNGFDEVFRRDGRMIFFYQFYGFFQKLYRSLARRITHNLASSRIRGIVGYSSQSKGGRIYPTGMSALCHQSTTGCGGKHGLTWQLFGNCPIPPYIVVPTVSGDPFSSRQGFCPLAYFPDDVFLQKVVLH
jgi:hypothetical protein